MPTYNYRCESCKSDFSIMQSIKDEPLNECAKCNGIIKRVIGGNFGLIFKGSGFYLTDYVKKNKDKKAIKSKGTKKKDNKK